VLQIPNVSQIPNVLQIPTVSQIPNVLHADGSVRNGAGQRHVSRRNNASADERAGVWLARAAAGAEGLGFKQACNKSD